MFFLTSKNALQRTFLGLVHIQSCLWHHLPHKREQRGPTFRMIWWGSRGAEAILTNTLCPHKIQWFHSPRRVPLAKEEDWNYTFWKNFWHSKRKQKWLLAIKKSTRRFDELEHGCYKNCGRLKFYFILTQQMCLWMQVCASWHKLLSGGKGPECPY